MVRRQLVTGFVVLAVLSGSGQFVRISAQATVERSVLVTVLDDDFAPVKNLTVADFVITEDGVAREVSEVVPATVPLCVGLLIDTTKPPMGTPAPTRDLRAGLLAFVRAVGEAAPDTEFGLMEFAGAAVQTQSFTAKIADVERRVGRLFPGQQVSAVMLEGLVDISKSLAKRPCLRRAIVTVDFDSQEVTAVQPNKIAEAVQMAGAAIWSVSIRGGGNNSAAQRDVVLDALTESTGGLRQTAVGPAALEALLTHVAHALTSQYLVVYERPDGAVVTRVRASAKRGSKVLATRVVNR